MSNKLHRTDGPAIERSNVSKQWYLNGKLHREYEPAIEYPDGSKYWYLNGKRHREDGPAIKDSNGNKYWYLNDKEYTQQEFNSKISRRKNTCEGKIVEIDGKKYKLTKVK